jgi:hypothetical protein
MSTEQINHGTSALMSTQSIYNKHDELVKQRETCQKSKLAPSRGFQESVEAYYNRHNIKPVALGPGAP